MGEISMSGEKRDGEGNLLPVYSTKRYEDASKAYNDLLNTSISVTAIDRLATAAATKSILQEIYVDIPFIQMKKEGYDWYVEAPQ